MKLSYRGVSYESTRNTIETIETKVAASFRGQTYQVRRPVNLPVSQPTANLMYRGAAYSIKQEVASESLHQVVNMASA